MLSAERGQFKLPDSCFDRNGKMTMKQADLCAYCTKHRKPPHGCANLVLWMLGECPFYNTYCDTINVVREILRRPSGGFFPEV